MSDDNKAQIQQININNYSYSKQAYIMIDHGNNEGNTTIKLTVEDAEQFIALAMNIFEKRKQKIIKQIKAIELPPLLEYNKEKTIDTDDDVPF